MRDGSPSSLCTAIRWAAVAGLGLGAGCITYSPLIRGAHYGAPGRLEAGQLEISGTAGGVAVPEFGGLQVGYGITDWAALEGGATLNLVDSAAGLSIGYLGTRFTYVRKRRAPIHFIGDVELGLGMGLGGALLANQPRYSAASGTSCSACDGRAWSDRLAGGGYQGIGLGGKFHYFSLYVRLRVEESQAQGTPLTLWPSAFVGGEFDIRHRVAIGLGGGYLGYFNNADQGHLWMYQLSVTVFIDARWARQYSLAAPR